MKIFKYIILVISLIFLNCNFICSQSVSKSDYLNPKLPIDDRVANLISQLTLDEKISFLYVTNPAIERLGIKEYHYGNEALHGIVRRNGKATVFPQSIGLASTWNPDLIFKVASAISDEARAKHNENNGSMKGGEIWGGQFDGLLTFFSPTINMARDPRWGRTSETYGEDPVLTSEIAKAFIMGMQGNDKKYLKTICTPKHFSANNEEHNRFHCNVEVSEKTLREYYLKAFEASIVEAKAGSIMTAYNAINGIPCSANKWLISDILRNEWGFKGYVVTDCGAIKHLYAQHRFAKDSLDAAVMAIIAGIDMECGGKKDLSSNIKIALKKGLIVESDLNNAVSNILRGRFLLGMFDPDEMVPYNAIQPEIIGSKKHVDLALQSARESVVLLKNEKTPNGCLLPLNQNENKKILVVGPNADKWQFGERNYSGVPVNGAITPLQGLQNILGNNVQINHIPWVSELKSTDFQIISESIVPGDFEYGFRGSYFGNSKTSESAGFSRTDPVIDFDWENMPPDPFIKNKDFLIEWEGLVVPSLSGIYQLKIEVAGGYKLEINERLQIDQWMEQSYREDYHTLNVQKGDSLKIKLSFHSTGKVLPLIRLKWKYPQPGKGGFDEVIEAAKNNDVIIAVMGLDSHDVVEGKDRDKIDLPEDQEKFIRELYIANPNIIVVLVNGNPLSINWIDKHIPAVIEAWFPGEQGGTAIADVITGIYNPAGRLPLTFYKSISQLPPFNSYEISKGHTYMFLKDRPLYPFGHGLSYTSFEYGDIHVNKTNKELEIEIDITNNGNRDGDEVVQLYFSTDSPEENIPTKRLFAFKRIHVDAGKKVNVRFQVTPEKAFSFFNPENKKFEITHPEIIVMAGSSSSDIRKKHKLSVK